MTISLYQTDSDGSDLLVIGRGDQAWAFTVDAATEPFDDAAANLADGTWEPSEEVDGLTPTTTDNLTPVAEWTLAGVRLLVECDQLGEAARDYFTRGMLRVGEAHDGSTYAPLEQGYAAVISLRSFPGSPPEVGMRIDYRTSYRATSELAMSFRDLGLGRDDPRRHTIAPRLGDELLQRYGFARVGEWMPETCDGADDLVAPLKRPGWKPFPGLVAALTDEQGRLLLAIPASLEAWQVPDGYLMQDWGPRFADDAQGWRFYEFSPSRSSGWTPVGTVGATLIATWDVDGVKIEPNLALPSALQVYLR